MPDLEEVKQFLRIDFDDDDALLGSLMATAKALVESVLRKPLSPRLAGDETIKHAVIYAVSYLYETRTDADYGELMNTLAMLLRGMRKQSW